AKSSTSGCAPRSTSSGPSCPPASLDRTSASDRRDRDRGVDRPPHRPGVDRVHHRRHVGDLPPVGHRRTHLLGRRLGAHGPPPGRRARPAHRTTAGLLVLVTLAAGLAALVVLRERTTGRRFAVVLLALAAC